MSVLDREVVDGIALDENKNELRLLITDHLDWSDEYSHLLALQEKINSYIGFCEGKEYNEFYKDALIEYAIIEIHFKNEPIANAMDFLKQVQQQVNELGIAIECYIS